MACSASAMPSTDTTQSADHHDGNLAEAALTSPDHDDGALPH